MPENKPPMTRVEKHIDVELLTWEEFRDTVLLFDSYDKPEACVNYYNYEESCELTLIGYRPETDDERKKRLNKAKKDREAMAKIKLVAEEKERAMLQKLLAKYGAEA